MSGRRLAVRATIENPSADPLPYGFGLHSYFRLPFDPVGDPSRTSVVLPASEYWPTDGGIPTGERLPVDARLDFRTGQPMMGLKLDDVLTGLVPSGDEVVCRLIDESLASSLLLRFDRSIRELVVFTPPDHPGVIAVEPYTQTTDAIHLQERGIDAGLRVLGPGGRDVLAMVVESSG